MLHPGETWHGFDGLEDGYCMLDPIKVTVVCARHRDRRLVREARHPGRAHLGLPRAPWLRIREDQDFTILFLFSIGMTKAKWGTLLTTLIKFKEDYDANTPLSVVLPDRVAASPERYRGMGLRDLSDEMFDQYRRSNQMQHLQGAFSSLPVLEMIPADAYRQPRAQRGRARASSTTLAHRIVATSVVPYPPGIPMMMPGENTGAADGPHIGYLKALRDWDRRFPGFGHETHGVEIREGEQYVYCLKAEGAEKTLGAASRSNHGPGFAPTFSSRARRRR